MEGQGEILRIEARPADGQRDITSIKTLNLITDEIFQIAAGAVPRGALWRESEASCDHL